MTRRNCAGSKRGGGSPAAPGPYATLHAIDPASLWTTATVSGQHAPAVAISCVILCRNLKNVQRPQFSRNPHHQHKPVLIAFDRVDRQREVAIARGLQQR